MITSDELDLLIDLAKLIKKYGPETFERLSISLTSEEDIKKLVAVLQGISDITQQSATISKPIKSTYKKKSTPRSLAHGAKRGKIESYNEDRSLDAWSNIILKGKSKK
ncbi:MAG: hypothetical protein WC367_01400 [Methanoregula sp.]|jgi:predicted sugar kinase